MKAALPLAAALLLAGCFGGDAPDDDDPSALAPAGANETPPERPDGRDGGFAAFDETNRTEGGTGGLEHAHDLWGGRERVVLMDADAALAACCYATKPMASARLRLPESSLVYEGAGAVEVTLSKPERRACTNVYDPGGRMCSDRGAPRAPDPTGAPAGVHLWVRDAASKDFRDAGEVTWGKAMVLPVTQPRQTDMPHASRSLWEFEVRSADPKDDTLFFHARVEALRAPGAEVPEWPGHPDFYAESPVRRVLDAAGKTRESPMVLLDPAANEVARVAPDKLVSYGTRTLHVFVNITDVKTENPALKPGEWRLLWHNASGVLQAAGGEDHPGEAREHRWVLPVDDDGMDSPYADASRWSFGLQGIFEVSAGGVDVLTCSGGCAMYEAPYTIVVLATAEILPAEAYAVPPG